MTGWRAGYTFKAGSRQTGIPYTQAYGGQCNCDEFIGAMSNSDFYTVKYQAVGNDPSVAMPMYGNDCSAFVAICWGLTYNGNGRYNTTKLYNEYDSLGEYDNLKRGDAVVSKSAGHAFIVFQNWAIPPTGSPITTSYTSCYEQTPYNAKLTFWTYAQLQSGEYKPISKF